MIFKYFLSIGLSSLIMGCVQNNKKNFSNKLVTNSGSLYLTDFTKPYQINDETYGTTTSVSINGNKRVIRTNALPNHKTGEFPNNGNPNEITSQELSYSLPINPKFSGIIKWSREPGIAVNGVKFEPGTAEKFICDTGQIYRIEAIQNLIDLGLDHNHAHVQSTGTYHYHGVPTELIDLLDNGKDIILLGYAKDGYPMYYSKSGKYKPSFVISDQLRSGEVCEYNNPHSSMTKELERSQPDGTFVSDYVFMDGKGELDECNGIEIDGNYSYFITDEYPYISRCLKGEFTEKRPTERPARQHDHKPKPPRK